MIVRANVPPIDGVNVYSEGQPPVASGPSTAVAVAGEGVVWGMDPLTSGEGSLAAKKRKSQVRPNTKAFGVPFLSVFERGPCTGCSETVVCLLYYEQQSTTVCPFH